MTKNTSRQLLLVDVPGEPGEHFTRSFRQVGSIADLKVVASTVIEVIEPGDDPVHPVDIERLRVAAVSKPGAGDFADDVVEIIGASVLADDESDVDLTPVEVGKQVVADLAAMGYMIVPASPADPDAS